MNKELLTGLRADLKNSSEEKTCQSYTRFFREPVVYYGVPDAKMKEINSKHWKEVEGWSKEEQFALFEEMLKSDYCEEAFLVADWLPRLKKSFELSDLATFEQWIDKYLNNWAKIDTFCNHTVGDLLEMFPESINRITGWVKSNNRWMKRAAAVSLIIPAKHGKYLKEAFKIADSLIGSKDDMVQKGYGWLLKEESRKHTKEVYDYVVSKKAIMPRTAFRYAIELMPKELRAEAMKRD